MWWMWTMWKLTGPLTVNPGRGPQQVPSWKSVTVPRRKHDHEWLWTSGCLGLSFTWNPKREGKMTTEANDVVQWGQKEAAPSLWAVLCLSLEKHPRGWCWLGVDTSGAFWFRNNTAELTFWSGYYTLATRFQGFLASGTHILRSEKYAFIFQPWGDDTQME